jgi:hypothetical protein
MQKSQKLDWKKNSTMLRPSFETVEVVEGAECRTIDSRQLNRTTAACSTRVTAIRCIGSVAGTPLADARSICTAAPVQASRRASDASSIQMPIGSYSSVQPGELPAPVQPGELPAPAPLSGRSHSLVATAPEGGKASCILPGTRHALLPGQSDLLLALRSKHTHIANVTNPTSQLGGKT